MPSGKALLILAAGSECSTVEGAGDTFEALRACARKYTDGVTEADITADGVDISHLLTRYRFATSMFTFAYPKDFIFGKVPAPGTSKSVADIMFIMLAPLAAGQHAIEVRGRSGPPAAMAWDIKYHLTIGR